MTKSASVSTTIQATAPAPEAIAQSSAPVRPGSIKFTEAIHVAFDIATVHARNGFIFDPNSLPEIYPSMGQCTITMIQGHPSAYALDAASATTAHALDVQHAEYEAAVAAAAQSLMKQKEREAKKAELALEVHAARDALRRLTDKAAAI
jgi:hypothetical protein